MPGIIATVEWAGRSGWSDRIPRKCMPSALIWPSRECPPDVGNAGVSHFLLAERLRRQERHKETPVFYEHVVELPDEWRASSSSPVSSGTTELPRSAEFVDEVGEG